ncbi:hypothetical protein PVOR_04403 [Paenibacillus vortex V453]|uniref:Uncharacterized protein n=1 Tax=Paenibacillus vortex V453 TaxID=715225 RepID=A0A2R9T0W0_9BACL|nr:MULTISPECIES: hypothetical protein [Paenibacillus]EFU43196.1 hypothetical protein PVOR_04403 [Paenibacillus vortex V453]MDH6671378.1 hypothetical protein [Paenibacillus sp. LBL]MPY15683.1 hypothetical protein [Paenibacillus glucanolyticus]
MTKLIEFEAQATAIQTAPTICEEPIRYMEMFRFDWGSAERFIPWSDRSWNCGLFKISCGEAAGYAEYALPSTREFADLVRWASVFARLRGMPVTEAIRYAQQQQQWGSTRMLLAVSALADLEKNLHQHVTRERLGSLPLERSFLMDCSQAYYFF